MSTKTKPLAEEIGDRVSGRRGLDGHEKLGMQTRRAKSPRVAETRLNTSTDPIPVGSGGAAGHTKRRTATVLRHSLEVRILSFPQVGYELTQGQIGHREPRAAPGRAWWVCSARLPSHRQPGIVRDALVLPWTSDSECIAFVDVSEAVFLIPQCPLEQFERDSKGI